jgi:hypothetical protein
VKGVRGKGRGVRVTHSLALMAVLTVAALMPLRAQGRPASQAAAGSARQIEARHQIETFESVLEGAVGLGAQRWIQHMQAPETKPANIKVEVLLTGQTSARGFRLDGYGAVFDVEFPSIRRSVAWTMRTLERDDQIRGASTNAAAAGSAQRPAPPVDDPRIFYAQELTSALVTALLDQGGTVGIGPDEWLTVAARESLDLRFVPDDPATTLMMRVKGSDLAALREKRLTREELAKRIEVTQY